MATITRLAASTIPLLESGVAKMIREAVRLTGPRIAPFAIEVRPSSSTGLSRTHLVKLIPPVKGPENTIGVCVPSDLTCPKELSDALVKNVFHHLRVEASKKLLTSPRGTLFHGGTVFDISRLNGPLFELTEDGKMFIDGYEITAKTSYADAEDKSHLWSTKYIRVSASDNKIYFDEDLNPFAWVVDLRERDDRTKTVPMKYTRLK